MNIIMIEVFNRGLITCVTCDNTLLWLPVTIVTIQ